MDYKKNIRRVFFIFLFLFFILAAWIVKFVFFDARAVIASPYNRRFRLMDTYMARGDILDSAGNPLANTDNLSAQYKRVYPTKEKYAHIVGFSGYNSQGMESLYAPELFSISYEVRQRINILRLGGVLKGDTLITTLDSNLQAKAHESLSGKKGAIIAIEPQTGRILACASSPSFDPNRVYIEWDALKNDADNNPLLNRAANGLYPPSSVFKIITLTSAIRHLPDFENFTYVCTGINTFGGRSLRCYNENAHGELNYEDAFALSCNTYFAALAEAVGADNLILTANELLSNIETDAFLYLDAYVQTGQITREELAETAIGQGRTLVTPMHITLITCAIANDGRLMRPYIADSYQSASGKTVKKNLPRVSKTLFSSDECEILSRVMGLVTQEGGTAQRLDKDLNIAGKTGSAENSAGDDHGWFTAFAPVNNPSVVITIMVENCGGSGEVLPAAEEMIRLIGI